MEYVLETSALCKRYRDFAALNGLDMHIPKGSIYGFVGRNGAGKTTLIRLICGLQEPQSERAARYLAVIRERTDAMRSLTEELFRYSVITATAEELRREAVCLNDVLEQSLAGFYGALSAQGITPEIRMPEEKITRHLDAAALRRIFDNILSNAVKYADGDLTVRLLPDGAVTFSNRAPALSRVQAQRLFDRFYTVESARSATGLGLSIHSPLAWCAACIFMKLVYIFSNSRYGHCCLLPSTNLPRNFIRSTALRLMVSSVSPSIRWPLAS